MKQFFTAIAANLVTIAICVLGGIIILGALVASVASARPVGVSDGSIVVINLDRDLSDSPARVAPRSFLDDAIPGASGELPLRSAILAIEEAAKDDKVRGILIRGSIDAGGYQSGYAALREFRAAIESFRKTSNKPVHAFLVNPDMRDYYVASAASDVTIDPFGSLFFPGLASEQVYFAGMLEKYGIGVQVSRVGRFKAAVEPFTRSDMSAESRLQTEAYLGDMWSEVKQGVAASRGVDTVSLQRLADEEGMIQPASAKAARLVDRVAYYDELLVDLRQLTGDKKLTDKAGADSSTKTRTVTASSKADVAPSNKPIPQISLEDYALVAGARTRVIGAKQTIAVVYAEGDIVDGGSGAGMIGGDELARQLRDIRADSSIKALVLRVNSPGGSAIASETIRRELALFAGVRPVVVSMGTVAASGGYWISTAASRIFAEPNTITGSIGVFSLVPNFKGIANKNGVTFDTVKTGRFADLFTISRPRTPAELAVIQRSVDAIYDAFIERVSTARSLPADSVRNIAEGRVWSGSRAVQIGLVDTLGGLDAALRYAASSAKVVGTYEVREYPRPKSSAQLLTEMFEDKPEPVANLTAAGKQIFAGADPAHQFARDLLQEMTLLLSANDPRGLYARMPYILRVR